ncbi:hypothetical protein UFOVP711_20 [uncultured Caudovirales phage]|uniref:Uncharacterized protein n=1 Tax=uncultured Caudovirales phage TaxID=2100421 RepID=A0A6J5NNH2_9CAUD|nr:hypothetical protein UFOVP711_20 [uncultured Caudovirales phage]
MSQIIKFPNELDHGLDVWQIGVMNTTPDPIIPTVGTAVTLSWWSDSDPGTIIAVSASGKRITVQEDSAKRVDSNGMSDSQTWEYERNPEGATWVFSQRKNGRWYPIGQEMHSTPVCHIGSRRKYYDFSF